MEEKTQAAIQKSVEELFARMGFEVSASIEISEQDSDSIVCNVKTENDSNLLIGQGGINLQAIQHVARLLVRKSIPERVRFIIDINNYRQEKNQSIIELARQAANQALAERRAVILRPMSTYERRVVHMELSQNPSITTESIGEGEGRKVVIKPTGMID